MTSNRRPDSDAALLRRIAIDYREMPGLRLSLTQAVRLWGVAPDRCAILLDTLVSRGVLRMTTRGHYVDTRNGP